MKVEQTSRGFGLVNFTDKYDQSCSLQKSSLATEDCIWFGVDNAAITHPRMHLTQDMVKELLPYLQKFVETGELD